MKIATFKSPDWDKNMKELNKVKWKGSFQCTYKFENPDKGGEWIKNFMKYIRSCESYGRVATRRHFLNLVLNKGYGRGHMNTFFAAVKDAGIVDVDKKWNGKFTECTYTRGPNWNAYLEGRLKRV
tara:strand:+ start:234 stop:608 length:375 start_codon:yes stop_codon:yes gene_type:complete